MKKRLLDTNLIVRHLVQDHKVHAAAAERLFAACDRGEVRLVILPEVVAETVFVLESFYEHSRENIANVLGDLFASPGIDLADLEIYLDALALYHKSKLHFVDCVIASHAKARDLSIATFDKEFNKIPDVKVELE